jgi:hypothetical protein
VAVIGTFGISAIVLVGIALAGERLLADATPIGRNDLAVALVAAVFAYAAGSAASWLGLSVLGVYSYYAAANPRARQGAAIALAITAPMFWSRRLFSLFSDWFLGLDGAFVSWLTGLPRTGNTIDLRNGGLLWIAAPCSSVANISLMLLCWVIFQQTRSVPMTLRSLAWCAAGIFGVIFINVARIALMAVYPERYELIHGSIGSTATSYLISGVIIASCWLSAMRS